MIERIAVGLGLLTIPSVSLKLSDTVAWDWPWVLAPLTACILTVLIGAFIGALGTDQNGG